MKPLAILELNGGSADAQIDAIDKFFSSQFPGVQWWTYECLTGDGHSVNRSIDYKIAERQNYNGCLGADLDHLIKLVIEDWSKYEEGCFNNAYSQVRKAIDHLRLAKGKSDRAKIKLFTKGNGNDFKKPKLISPVRFQHFLKMFGQVVSWSSALSSITDLDIHRSVG